MATADSNYSPNPWMKNIPIQAVQADYQNYEDQLRYESLVESLSLSAEEARMVRPTVGNVPFPPRNGYSKKVPDIQDVLSIGMQTLRRDNPTANDLGIEASRGPGLGIF